MKFQLSEEDAARYGCPRIVEYDESKLMLRELIAMEKLGWPIERLMQHAEGTPLLDDAGNQIYQTDDAGNRVLEDGKPIPLRTFNPEALGIMVWVAVRRMSPTPPEWELFDVNVNGLLDAMDDPGKESNRASRRASKATNRRSPTRTGSSRGRSTS